MARKGKLKLQKKHKDAIERPERLKLYRYLFLIVCEDEKTEPIYFQTFKSKIPPNTLYLETVGTGRDPQGVTEQAIQEKILVKQKAQKEVDVVWVVFDTDDANLTDGKRKRFEEAFKIARKEGFEVAYSNEVFEVWLLLHLRALDNKTLLPRSEIYRLLEESIRQTKKYQDFEYKHGTNANILVDVLFEVGNQSDAIERAKQLFHQQKGRSPIEANPSTKVHILVEELLKWIKYFEWKPE